MPVFFASGDGDIRIWDLRINQSTGVIPAGSGEALSCDWTKYEPVSEEILFRVHPKYLRVSNKIAQCQGHIKTDKFIGSVTWSLFSNYNKLFY